MQTATRRIILEHLQLGKRVDSSRPLAATPISTIMTESVFPRLSYYQTTLLDGDKDINLLSHFTLTQNTGEYYGYVVYGSKSKIVVYIGEDLPTDLQGLSD